MRTNACALSGTVSFSPTVSIFPSGTAKTPEKMQIRFRTLGDLTITGAIESDADTLEKITAEVAATRVTERGGRVDDKRSETSMEDRKKEGYF